MQNENVAKFIKKPFPTAERSGAQTEAAEFSVQPNAPNSAAQTPKERSRN